MTIETIIFDLDNTLTDRQASILAFSQQFFIDFREKLDKNVTFDRVHQVIHIGDGSGYRPKDDMFREIQRDLRWIDRPTLDTIATYWYSVSAQQMQLRQDVIKTLKELQKRDYTLGMITNGKTAVQNATIDATQIREYFPTIVISEACGFRKPSPEIFNIALSNLKKHANSALYIGDNPDADIQGARNAGLVSVWFANESPFPKHLQTPDHQINRISQILEILESKT